MAKPAKPKKPTKPRKPNKQERLEDWIAHFHADKAKILLQHLENGLSMSEACQMPGTPSRPTVYRWLWYGDAHPESEQALFGRLYARAREAGADLEWEKTFALVDDGTNDYMAVMDPENPGYRLNGEAVARSRLRFDQRRWALGKMAPRKYGEKVLVGNDPDNPLPAPQAVTNINLADLRARLKEKPEPPDND